MEGGGEGDEEVSVEELASNLSIYKDQLHQVRQPLNDDHANSDYVDMERELTEDLESSSDHQGKYPVGAKVHAIWSEDGEWYDATIETYTPNGYYVFYDNWGNRKEVDPANVRLIEEGTVDALLEIERAAEATKQAIKRKIAQAASIDFQSKSLPAKLRIEPDDPEDVKAAKRKKMHAFKSKMRIEQLEVTQNNRQNAWQQFQSTKGKAKKANAIHLVWLQIGFFSGRKRESIFKSPDDPEGKVGVTGSGKGLTEF
ncbi:hypothetical protein Lal_00049575 [Lupinus albus]|nr:hypothetical protein Lal_00049575 [Lupinus albus]